jgi:hypothetical protein
MKKDNLLKFRRKAREITPGELNQITVLKDTAVITAVCRAIGRTDWDDIIKDGSFWSRGKWMGYPDGEEVFSWDGKELLLFGPVVFNHGLQKFGRMCTKLTDQSAGPEHHTKEDEAG